MNRQRVAVIDMGTNTFNLLIAEPRAEGFDILHREQAGVSIGQGGLSQGLITEEAQDRLLQTMLRFSRQISRFRVPDDQVRAIATSAFRSARNAREIQQEVKRQTGIQVDIISGEVEAEYIYHGVKAALDLGETNALVVDVGGGSVEFIICNQRKIHWKKSLDIGGQRLMDQFMRSDPISELDMQRLDIYLESQLWDLSTMVFNYGPKYLVGSSGTFDTLAEIDFRKTQPQADLRDFVDEEHQLLIPEYEITPEDFHYIYQDIVRNDRATRLTIPGMIELRVDMIVVATCLLKFIVEKYELESIRISAYAMKEGYLVRHLL